MRRLDRDALNVPPAVPPVLMSRKAIREKAIHEGISPLEVLLWAMRELYQRAVDEPNLDARIRPMLMAVSVAKEAAPYIHSKLASVSNLVTSEPADVSLRVRFVDPQDVIDAGESAKSA
jgi:hypothetical protein